MRTLSILAGLALALPALPAAAATLVDSTTPGLYNAGIGTVLDGTNPFGGTFMFPIANVKGGDPTLTIPAGNAPDLSAAAAALGNWLTTPAAPGGTWSGTGPIPGTWAVNTETAIIYEIDGGATGLVNVEAAFGVDNGLFVWLNGVFLGGRLDRGHAIPGEYVFALGALAPGASYLQVLRADHGRRTGWIVSVTGEVAPDPSVVPLPASAVLLLGGLAALAAAASRRTRDRRTRGRRA